MLLPFALAACEKAEDAEKATPAPSPAAEQHACSDPAIVERLRAMIVARATQLKPSDAAAIDSVGRAATVQVLSATVAERDAALNLVVCRTQLSFALPQGAVDAFDGSRQLAAALRFAVQRTADGSLAVHQVEGAEPLAYRLAAVPMRMTSARPTPSPATSDAPDVRPAERTLRRTIAEPAPPAPPRRGLPEPALTSRGRPSFDCQRAGSRVERMICGDERLAALDRVAASLYARTLSRTDRNTRALLRQSQARFIERRDDCRRAGCVADRYRARLDEIDRVAGR